MSSERNLETFETLVQVGENAKDALVRLDDLEEALGANPELFQAQLVGVKKAVDILRSAMDQIFDMKTDLKRELNARVVG